MQPNLHLTPLTPATCPPCSQVMHSRQADAEHARTLAASAVSRMRTLVDSLVAQHPHLAGDHELQVGSGAGC